MLGGQECGSDRRAGSCSITDAMATKHWQVSNHSLVVRPINGTCSDCRNATRALALVGDRRSSLRPANCGERRALFLAVATVLLPAAANPGPAVGSAFSGSVEISVSVAPRYKVLAVSAPDAARVRPRTHSDRLCLATNSSAPTMPVMLVRPTTRRQHLRKAGSGEDMQLAEGAETEIWRCGLMKDQSTSRVVNPMGWSASQLLLVRPE